MADTPCRRCGYALREGAICQHCGEDHRGWFEKLWSRTPARSPLQRTEQEVGTLTDRLRQSLRALQAERRRLQEHRAATAAGAEVVRATLERLHQGIASLEDALREAAAQQAGVESLRYRMALSDLRAGAFDDPRTVARVASDGTLALPDGDVIAIVGDRAQRWGPADALSPRWSVPAAGAPRAVGDRVVLGRGTLIDPATGLTTLRLDREIVAVGAGIAVTVAENGHAGGGYVEVIALPDEPPGAAGSIARPAAGSAAAPFRIVLDHELISASVDDPGGRPAAVLIRTSEGLERWEVTTDRPPALTLRARRRLGPQAPLIASDPPGQWLAFPMVLDAATLEPVAALLRPGGARLGPRWLMVGGVALSVGEEVWAWRFSEPSAPIRVELHDHAPDAAPPEVVRHGHALILRRPGAGPVGLDLSRWPPRRLDAVDQARARLAPSHPEPRPPLIPPRRHRLRQDGSALIREDRIAAEGWAFCEEIAAYALAAWQAHAPEPGPGASGGGPTDPREALRESLAAICRDALVVSAECHTREAARIARALCGGGAGAAGVPGVSGAPVGHERALEEMAGLLDRICAPMALLQALPAALMPDDASAERVRGLFADCVDTVLRELAEFIGRCADPAQLLAIDIAPVTEFLPRLRTMILERSPGLPWTGLDRVMRRFKQLIGDSRQLQDVAAAARALPSLAAASSALRSADLGVDPAVLERLGRSLQDIAAASRADAEVDALWRPSSEGDLRSRVEAGMDRLRHDLRRLDVKG